MWWKRIIPFSATIPKKKKKRILDLKVALLNPNSLLNKTNAPKDIIVNKLRPINSHARKVAALFTNYLTKLI